MANDISTKVWDLDTVGVISVNPVQVEGISVTWTSTAGTQKEVVLSQVNQENRTAGAEIFSASRSSSTVGIAELTQYFDIQGTFHGMNLTTITSAAKILVYTK
jgi:hypothetical protein